MDTKPINPLTKHFRRPTIYIKLPSAGRHWPENTLDLPVTGVIPVYPMTNADEITLKTPDALINGSGVVQVIHSCCPNIKDAWRMPSVDVDAVLIAIRIASYGSDMTVSAKCPSCKEEHDYSIDLSNLLERIHAPNFGKTVDYDGLKIKLQPQEYFSMSQTGVVQFEEQKIAQTLSNPDIPDEVRNARLKESMKTLLDLNEKLLVDSTEYIETEDGSKVTDPEFIKEFYRNADGRVSKEIEAQLAEFAKEGALPLTQIGCTGCDNQWQIPLEFDYSRFFVTGS